MELRNRNLNIINKKEEIKMELRRIGNTTKDVLAESVYALGYYVDKFRTRMPKDLVNNYSNEGKFYGYNYRGIGTIEGFRVVKASSLMRDSFIFFGGAYTEFPTEDGKYTNTVITVDSNFEVLSTNAKRFVLYHEVGHLKDPRGSEVVREEALVRGLEDSVSDGEKIADNYAVRAIGKKNSVKALKEVISHLEGTFLDTTELEERIIRIQEVL